MNTKKTKGFPIEYPMTDSGSPSVFKVYFGKSYLIWKGKSLSQSCDLIAKSIAAKMRQTVPVVESDWMYHVYSHIKRTRCLHGRVEVVDNDFLKASTGGIDAMSMLKMEQRLLDQSKKDPLCLNNNVQAYVPESNSYISDAIKAKFLTWYETRKK